MSDLGKLLWAAFTGLIAGVIFSIGHLTGTPQLATVYFNGMAGALMIIAIAMIPR